MTASAAEDSILAPRFRALSLGVVLMVSVVAFQALGVNTIMPAVARDLGGLAAYGWAFSAFMLASVGGIVAAGQAADRRGLLPPFLIAVCGFALGCGLAAAAGRWEVLLVARALQGGGDGAVLSLVNAAIARAYPPALFGRMMALVSSAFVVPSLVGPAASGLIAEHLGWRLVFIALLPVLLAAVVLAVPALRTLPRPARTEGATERRLPAALAVIAGLGLVLAALEARSPVALLAVVPGIALGAPAARRLLPAGTLRARRGLPAGVLVRGLLIVAFLGCDAFLPLGLTRLRGLSLAEAGLVISAGSLSWSLGAAVQARLDARDGGRGRARRVAAGLLVLLAGLGSTAAALLAAGLPTPVAALGWMVAGLGIGLANPSVGAIVLSQAPAGQEGRVSSSLQLAEAVALALFTGLGGAVIALGLDRGWADGTAIAAIFAGAGLAALAALAAARRIAGP